MPWFLTIVYFTESISKKKNSENRFSLEFRMTSKELLTKKKDFYSIEKDRIIKL